MLQKGCADGEHRSREKELSEMQSEEDQPAMNLWNGNQQIRAVTVRRKNMGKKKSQKQKHMKWRLQQSKDFAATARVGLDLEKRKLKYL